MSSESDVVKLETGSLEDGKKIGWWDRRTFSGLLKRLFRALVVGLLGSFTTTAIAYAYILRLN